VILSGLIIGKDVLDLAIIGQKLTSQHISQLIEYIKVSNKLVKIDLSWSKVKADKILPLLKQICISKRLEYINLAWVGLIKC